MLFSNDEVAAYINANFEPAWESVRPVPLVTVDFGGGNVIRRTLRGNIATYATDAEGRTLDILPGVYEPKTYLKQLRQLELLHRWAESAGPRRADAVVRDYHKKQFETLKAGKPSSEIIARVVPRVSIIAVESGVRYVLSPAKEQQRLEKRGRVASLRREIPNLDSPTELAEWKPLFDDTKRNESVRRMQIHEYLKDKGLVAPASMTKWLYREVLDADLDDPYLGLGKLLKPGEADDH